MAIVVLPHQKPVPYEEMYHTLFNAITDALEYLPPSNRAAEILMKAQQKTEAAYVASGSETAAPEES